MVLEYYDAETGAHDMARTYWHPCQGIFGHSESSLLDNKVAALGLMASIRGEPLAEDEMTPLIHRMSSEIAASNAGNLSLDTKASLVLTQGR